MQSLVEALILKQKMTPDLLISIFGILIFSSIMYFGYKYADGKWNVSESKRFEYQNWANNHGKTMKKSIVIISILYGIGMLIQIFNQI